MEPMALRFSSIRLFTAQTVFISASYNVLLDYRFNRLAGHYGLDFVPICPIIAFLLVLAAVSSEWQSD
jgi:hypothetical protein